MIQHLRQKYCSELMTHLISHFPFSLNFAKSQTSQNQLSCILSMDFVLCHIMLLLHPTPENHTSSMPPSTPVDKAVANMADIIYSFFMQLGESDKLAEVSSAPNAVLTLVAFLPLLLLQLCRPTALERERQSSMLRSIWAIYKACHPLSSSRQSLVKCFSEQLKVALEQHKDHSRSAYVSGIITCTLCRCDV